MAFILKHSATKAAVILSYYSLFTVVVVFVQHVAQFIAFNEVEFV